MRRMIDEKLYAKKKQEAWITPTLLNGWAGTIQYRRNEFGNIEFRGSMDGTSGIYEVDIFVLPTGYTPNETVFIVYATSNPTIIGRARISAIGGFRIYSSPTSPHFTNFTMNR